MDSELGRSAVGNVLLNGWYVPKEGTVVHTKTFMLIHFTCYLVTNRNAL